MIEDLTRGRIWKGSVSQITVVAFPHCYDPERVNDLVIDFYTKEGGYAIEFSGETIEMSGNTATVVLQVPQIDMLDDGLLRYVVEYDYDGEHKVADLETKFYVKTPNEYTPIEVVTPEAVEEVVDEKIDEKGIVTKDYVRDFVDSALTEYSTTEQIDGKFAAESARTENVYAKKSELEGFATKKYVESAITENLSAYTPTTNFATINGSGITSGGNIEIKGGSGSNVNWSQTLSGGTQIATITIDGVSQNVYAPNGGGQGGATIYNLDTMSRAERATLYMDLYTTYARREDNYDPTKFKFLKFLEDDIVYGYQEFIIVRFDSGGNINFAMAFGHRWGGARLYNVTFSLNSYGDIVGMERYALDNENVVTNVRNVSGIWQGTQAEYDAISTKDPNTLYVVKD